MKSFWDGLEGRFSFEYGSIVSAVEQPRTAPDPTRAPEAPSRSERRKARTEQAILEAAEHKFLQHGFHATTVEEIAAEADVSVGSIYVHFQSKEGLYLALIERALEIEERYMNEAFKPTLSLGQQLFAAGWAYLRFYLDHPGYFRILMLPHTDAQSDPPPPTAQRLAERAEAQVRRVAANIELGVKTGAARPVDPYRAAKFMWGAWSGVIALNLRPDRLRLDDDELRAVLEQGQRLIAEGIASMGLRLPDGSLRPEFDGIPPELDGDRLEQSSSDKTTSIDDDKGASQ
jgi:TetR/AcrR family transcriptional regulator